MQCATASYVWCVKPREIPERPTRIALFACFFNPESYGLRSRWGDEMTRIVMCNVLIFRSYILTVCRRSSCIDYINTRFQPIKLFCTD
jgi:hypothetical protein